MRAVAPAALARTVLWVALLVCGGAAAQVAAPSRVAPNWGAAPAPAAAAPAATPAPSPPPPVAPAAAPATAAAPRTAPPASAMQDSSGAAAPASRPPRRLQSMQPAPATVAPAASPGVAPAPAPAAAGAVYAPPDSPAALARLPDDALVGFADGSVRITAAELRKSLPALERQAQASMQPAPPPATAADVSMGVPRGAGSATRAIGIAVPAAARGGAVAPLNCSLQQTLGAEPRITAIDGVARGAVLTPADQPVVITGCGFGPNTGRAGVYLVATQHGFLHRLQAWSWNDTQIRAMWETAPSGLQDFDGLSVRIELADGRTLEQDGHRFVALRETRVLGGWNRERLTSAGTRPMPTLLAGDGSSTSGIVETRYSPDAQFCDPKLTRVDRLRFGGLRLPGGWQVQDVVLRNLTSQEVADTGETFWPPAYVTLGRDARVQNPFDARWEGDELVVTPQWHSLYFKRFLWMGGFSQCSSAYAFAVVVAGPKGTWQ